MLTATELQVAVNAVSAQVTALEKQFGEAVDRAVKEAKVGS